MSDCDVPIGKAICLLFCWRSERANLHNCSADEVVQMFSVPRTYLQMEERMLERSTLRIWYVAPACPADSYLSSPKLSISPFNVIPYPASTDRRGEVRIYKSQKACHKVTDEKE